MLRFSLLLFLCAAGPAIACQGPETEIAQERDASVIFEGQPIAYELSRGIIQQPGAVKQNSPEPLAKVTFKVTKPIRGEKREQWAAIMRGSGLPKSLQEFTRRFSSYLKVGLRDVGGKIDHGKLPKDFSGLFFIVDAACSMDGEDWLLRPIRLR